MSPHPAATGHGKIPIFCSHGRDLADTPRLIQPRCFPEGDGISRNAEVKKRNVARSNAAAVSPSVCGSPESKQNLCPTAHTGFTLPAAPVSEEESGPCSLPPRARAFCKTWEGVDVGARQPAQAIPHHPAGEVQVLLPTPSPRLRAALLGRLPEPPSIFWCLLSADKFCRGEPGKELCFQLRSLQLFLASQMGFPVARESAQLCCVKLPPKKKKPNAAS